MIFEHFRTTVYHLWYISHIILVLFLFRKTGYCTVFVLFLMIFEYSRRTEIVSFVKKTGFCTVFESKNSRLKPAWILGLTISVLFFLFFFILNVKKKLYIYNNMRKKTGFSAELIFFDNF